MNYFLLADTEFFRRINEAGDCNMETAYMAFANQVIELCSSMNTSHAIIALAYIEIELQHHPMRVLSEERKGSRRLYRKGTLFREEDAKVPYHSPSAATILSPFFSRNAIRQSRSAASMDGQCHRPCGTYLRHL